MSTSKRNFGTRVRDKSSSDVSRSPSRTASQADHGRLATHPDTNPPFSSASSTSRQRASTALSRQVARAATVLASDMPFSAEPTFPGRRATTVRPRVGQPSKAIAKARKRARPPQLPTTVAIYERVRAHSASARDTVRALGYRLAIEATKSAVLSRLRGPERPHVLLLGMPDGVDILTAALAQGDDRPITVLAYGCSPAEAMMQCSEAGADLFVIRPHSPHTLAAVLHSAATLANQRSREIAQQGTQEVLRSRLSRYGEADSTTGFQHFDFFKQLLARELKRARRYRYPLGVCLVAVDALAEDSPAPAQVTQLLRIRVASAIAACIRDIDLPVDYTHDRFLLFLPYTDLAGAERVAHRVAASVAQHGQLCHEGISYRLSVSIGVSAQRAGRQISFAKLMRDAGAAVRAAQLKGGGRVVVRQPGRKRVDDGY